MSKILRILSLLNLIVGFINILLGWFFYLPLNFILGCSMLLSSLIGMVYLKIEALITFTQSIAPLRFVALVRENRDLREQVKELQIKLLDKKKK